MNRLRPLPESLRETVYNIIKQNYPSPPLGFIRKASREGLIQWYCDDILMPGKQPSNLTYLWDNGSDQEWVIVSNHLKWDSDWFGKNIVKLEVTVPMEGSLEPIHHDLKELLKDYLNELQERRYDYVFVNVPATNVSLIKSLGEAGFSLIETRLTYWLDNIDNFEPSKRYPVRIAESQDVPYLSRIAAEIVNTYDRFHADDFFDADKVDSLMEEWVNASVNKGFADVVIVPNVDNKIPGALMTAKYLEEKWDVIKYKLSQMVFSVVAPEFTGWYLKLVSETTVHLKERGAEGICLTTQATNTAVLRVWESLGYKFGEASLIFRRVLR